jgi:hypothetical protein
VRAIVCGSIRNEGLLPATTTAQQISRISQAQMVLEIHRFHNPRLALPGSCKGI